MKPYKIISATLTKYSGINVDIAIDCDFITIPKRIIEDRILDTICNSFNNPKDPFVKIKLKTKSLFNE